jgi:hypothetical protein
MPNWCYNNLNVDGCRKDIDSFQQDCFSKDKDGEVFLDFEKIVPPPENYFSGDLGEEERAYCKENGLENLYDWNKKNWGTKWNSSDVYIKDKGDSICLNFATAWSPPIPVIATLIAKYPTLDFLMEYIEVGASFKGTFAGKKGTVVLDECRNLTE